MRMLITTPRAQLMAIGKPTKGEFNVTIRNQAD